MIPPIQIPSIPIKTIICTRAVCNIVLDRIMFESVDETILPTVYHWANCPSPTDLVYIGVAIYYLHAFLSANSPKQRKLSELDEYVLSKPVYNRIKMLLLIIFMLIKTPANST